MVICSRFLHIYSILFSCWLLSLDFECGYTQNKTKASSKSHLSTIFVNEVLESEKLKVIKFKTILGNIDTSDELHQFQKHHNIKSPQPSEKDYKKDSLGRRYRNFPFNGSSRMDEYVARDSVTIPRYLIVFQQQDEK